MLPKEETLTIEFKSDHPPLKNTDLFETIVGLANTKGGFLYIGIEDDGTVTGVQQSHLDPVGITALIANNTIPPQSVRAEQQGIDKPVLVIEVAPNSSIVSTSSGKVMRRRIKVDGSPETVPMYPHEFMTRLSDLSLLDFSAQVLRDATVDDLDPLERQRLRNMIRINRGEAVLLELSDEELDRALQLVRYDGERERPTVTGILLLGKPEALKRLIPTAGLSFQVLKGSDVVLNETLDNSILVTLDSVQDYMKAWNPERELSIGMLRLSIPDFDYRAFREAIINAFAHRDYSIMHRVRIQIDDDGLQITNPGGFIEGIDIDTLLTAEPRSRNPSLADALKRIGLAERTGRGIDRIYEGALTYGRPLPDYSGSSSNSVKLFMQRANPDPAFTKLVSEAIGNQQLHQNVFALMILYNLRHTRRSTIDIITAETHIEKHRVKAAIERLVETGYVEASGNGKGKAYLLSSKVYRELNEAVNYVRQTDIDKIRHPELIMKLARQKGEITRGDIIDLLHLTPPQAYKQLKKMVDNGSLKMKGTKRIAVYYIPKKSKD